MTTARGDGSADDEPVDRLRSGDRIRVWGGYDMEPQWPCARQPCEGTVETFIPGQNETPAAVVELDATIVWSGITGRILVLELRYAGAEWTAQGTVHVELCDFMPPARRWQDRRRGVWVESHARYRRLEDVR